MDSRYVEDAHDHTETADVSIPYPIVPLYQGHTDQQTLTPNLADLCKSLSMLGELGTLCRDNSIGLFLYHVIWSLINS